MRALLHLCINQQNKFEVRSFNDSKDIIEPKLKTSIPAVVDKPARRAASRQEVVCTLSNGYVADDLR